MEGGIRIPTGDQGAAVTDDQRVQIQQLQERDDDSDRQLDAIGDGIADLADIAEMQGEEVQLQNAMLENLGDSIDNAEITFVS